MHLHTKRNIAAVEAVGSALLGLPWHYLFRGSPSLPPCWQTTPGAPPRGGQEVIMSRLYTCRPPSKETVHLHRHHLSIDVQLGVPSKCAVLERRDPLSIDLRRVSRFQELTCLGIIMHTYHARHVLTTRPSREEPSLSISHHHQTRDNSNHTSQLKRSSVVHIKHT